MAQSSRPTLPMTSAVGGRPNGSLGRGRRAPAGHGFDRNAVGDDRGAQPWVRRRAEEAVPLLGGAVADGDRDIETSEITAGEPAVQRPGPDVEEIIGWRHMERTDDAFGTGMSGRNRCHLVAHDVAVQQIEFAQPEKRRQLTGLAAESAEPSRGAPESGGEVGRHRRLEPGDVRDPACPAGIVRWIAIPQCDRLHPECFDLIVPWGSRGAKHHTAMARGSKTPQQRQQVPRGAAWLWARVEKGNGGHSSWFSRSHASYPPKPCQIFAGSRATVPPGEGLNGSRAAQRARPPPRGLCGAARSRSATARLLTTRDGALSGLARSLSAAARLLTTHDGARSRAASRLRHAACLLVAAVGAVS